MLPEKSLSDCLNKLQFNVLAVYGGNYSNNCIIAIIIITIAWSYWQLREGTTCIHAVANSDQAQEL